MQAQPFGEIKRFQGEIDTRTVEARIGQQLLD